MQEEESLAELIAAWNLLEYRSPTTRSLSPRFELTVITICAGRCADFAGFWKATANMSDLNSAPGLTTAIRSCNSLFTHYCSPLVVGPPVGSTTDQATVSCSEVGCAGVVTTLSCTYQKVPQDVLCSR